jgi:hypothetical protein
MPKLLILAANPTNTNRLCLEEELRDVDEGLRRAQHRDRFTLPCAYCFTATTPSPGTMPVF